MNKKTGQITTQAKDYTIVVIRTLKIIAPLKRKGIVKDSTHKEFCD